MKSSLSVVCTTVVSEDCGQENVCPNAVWWWWWPLSDFATTRNKQILVPFFPCYPIYLSIDLHKPNAFVFAPIPHSFLRAHLSVRLLVASLTMTVYWAATPAITGLGLRATALKSSRVSVIPMQTWGGGQTRSCRG